MTPGLTRSWLLALAAAAALALAAFGPPALRWPLLAVAGGSALLVAGRRGGAHSQLPRIELLSKVTLAPRASAVLLRVDGSGWLVVMGEGYAQLARAELAPPPLPSGVPARGEAS